MTAISSKAAIDLWQDSDGQFGWISIQLNPYLASNTDQMLGQALALSEVSPNVMIKAPGSCQGYEVIEELTARGIATNNTLCFTVSQAKAYVSAVKRGIERARMNNVNLSRWRSVITFMIGRFGTKGKLVQQAEEKGFKLSEIDIRKAELMVFDKIYKIIEKAGIPSKLLLSSIRLDSDLEKNRLSLKQKHIHIQRTCNCNIIYTLPPKTISEILSFKHLKPFIRDSDFQQEISGSLMQKLLKIPYFLEGYMEDGISSKEFSRYSAFINLISEVRAATDKFVSMLGVINE